MLASFRDLTGNISIHHNLFASSRERHPTLASGEKTRPGMIVDFRDNVVYNLSGATNLGDAHINFINNFYRPGPTRRTTIIRSRRRSELADKLKVYLSGNVFEENPAFTHDNYLAITFDRWTTAAIAARRLQRIRVDHEFDVDGALPARSRPAKRFNACCNTPGHRSLATRPTISIVKGIRDRKNRMIDSEDEVGGWPTSQHAGGRSIPTATACPTTGNAATDSTRTIPATAMAIGTATDSRISKNISTACARPPPQPSIPDRFKRCRCQVE